MSNQTADHTVTKVIIVLTREIECVLGLFLNIWYLCTAIKYKHYKSRPTLILMFSQALADTLVLMGLVFYVAPAILLDDYFPSLATMEIIFGLETTISWTMTLVNFSALALERMYAVFAPMTYKSFVTSRRTVILTLVSWLVALSLYPAAKLSDVCCGGMIAAPELYSMKKYNPLNRLDTYQVVFDCLNYLTTAICVICYPSILIRKALLNKKIQTDAQTSVSSQIRKRNQEIRLSIQFLIITSFFIVTNVSFSIIAWMGGSADFVLAHGYFYAGNAFLNVIVYLVMNKEVGPQMVRVLCGRIMTQDGTLVSTVQSAV